MNDFNLIPLSRVVKRVKVGFVGSVNEYYCEPNEGVPIIRTTDIDDINFSNIKYITYDFHERNKKSQLKKGDLIIARHGNNGNAVIYEHDFEAQVLNAVIIEPNEAKVSSKLLKYFFESPFIKRQIKGVIKGSVQGVINTQHVADLLLNLSSNLNYDSITKLLSNLDAKIELNNKINEELEAMAKLIYDYWFVQFDFPISKEQAEVMGKPELEGKPYKSSGGKMVYNQELKREIPEGWDSGVLGDIASLIRGVSYAKKDIKSINDSSVTPILRATNITGKVIDLEDMVYVPDEFVDEKQLLNKFDILITMSSGSIDHIGKNGLFYFDEKVAFGAFCAKLVARIGFKFYLYSYTQSEFLKETIKNECLGTNINNLNSALVNSFRLIIPSNEILEQFNNTVNPVYSKISINFKENRRLTKLRDWLLPMLMNGQVTVGEAEEELSKAAEPEVKYKGEQRAKITPLFPQKEDKHFLKRKMLACYIINRSLSDPNFGDTKFEKLLHLSDYWAIQRNFEQKYYQKAAGPYDNAFTKQFFQQVLKAKWFRKISNGAINRIVAGENQEKSTSTYGFFTEEELAKVDQLIKYFKNYTYEQPEIISTLYAVWNNRLILNQEISDDLLKQDFLDWDEKKKKYKDRLDGALQWMKDEGLVPNGWGKLIEKPKSR